MPAQIESKIEQSIGAGPATDRGLLAAAVAANEAFRDRVLAHIGDTAPPSDEPLRRLG